MTDGPPRDDAADDRPTDHRATDDPATERPNDRTTDDGDRDSPQPMTDDTDTTDRTGTDADRADASNRTEPADSSGFGGLSTDGLRGLLDRVGLAALSLLAVIAGWGFYSQTGNAIRTWFDPAYQSVALALFNLAVLLVALAGVAHQLRRIRASES
ncbi:hypothetical protein EXE46_03795 [Halorubrum sp. GN11_10-6_MGM]|uniref:hypothetical protein n=1 Tax=Halorubrum sp. GN11_10-6_MGM TaxID=2518112 RepID=UPI0010F448ED|nr:hypothetical protein [Halorubrum sp. GN11_10-6_MGM]TKX75283.1 hypothetical protein EXE46_03795 [Halorubrum sp. GN11_10-6_MGM]